MTKEELLKTTRHKIDDINEKISVLAEMLALEPDAGRRNEMRSVINNLEEIRDNALVNFSRIEEIEAEDKRRLSEMEKNIFNGIRSFDDAFKNAGGIFKVR
jgi:hypothetical protein